MVNVVCISESCNETLPENSTKYCSKTCYKRESQRAYRAKKEGKKYELPVKELNQPKSATIRRGSLYKKFIDESYALDVVNENITSKEAAEALGCSTAQVSRMLAAYREDLQNQVVAENLEVSDDAKQS